MPNFIGLVFSWACRKRSGEKKPPNAIASWNRIILGIPLQLERRKSLRACRGEYLLLIRSEATSAADGRQSFPFARDRRDNRQRPRRSRGEVGEKSRSMLVEVGSMFWFLVNTVCGNYRSDAPGTGAVSGGDFLSIHRARRGRLGPAGRDGFIFPWPDDGASDRISVGALWDGTSCARVGCDRFYARTWTTPHRHHARGADRRFLHRRARHHAGVGGGRSDRSHGHWSAAVSWSLPGCWRSLP